MLGQYVTKTRKTHPLIHCITNYVTVNDVANVILACGGSPIMADEMDEVQDITSICQGLTLNIGTLNHRTVQSMLAAGKKAKELGHVVVLDPVGAGASPLRTRAAALILEEVEPDVIRGNISEIRALANHSGKARGVDADAQDAVNADNLDSVLAFLQAFAKKTGSVVAATGAMDLVCDGSRAYIVENGRPEMSQITGTGCQLSGLTAAFAASAPAAERLDAVAAAVCTMGAAGEIAYEHLAPYEGNATYARRIIDAVNHMDEADLNREARYERR
ncbi:MAG: hydroxyethylthiazole kinase [Pseudoramibacter sp.]